MASETKVFNKWLRRIKDKTLRIWLSDFTLNTARTYHTGLNAFKDVIGIDDFSDYFSSKPDIVTDFKIFVRSLEDRPSKTRSVYTCAVRVFFSDQDFGIPDKEINKLRRRGRLPKRTRASTRDKIPTKEQMRRVLDHLDSKGRALTLFLASTGCRIARARKAGKRRWIKGKSSLFLKDQEW